MVGFLEVVSIGATAISVGMVTSPILTMRSMAAQKSVGGLTIIFFCAQFVNCCVWSMYGVQKGALPVMLCNFVGTCVASYCVLTFLSIAKVEEKSGHKLQATTYNASLRTAMIAAFVVIAAMVVFFALLVGVSYFASSQANGLLGGFCSVFMLSSPLSQAGDIIKNKNAEPLQPVTLVLATLNSILWTMYGVLTLDPYIFVPNGLCTAACFFQVYLVLRYGRRPTEKVEPSRVAVAEVP